MEVILVFPLGRGRPNSDLSFKKTYKCILKSCQSRNPRNPSPGLLIRPVRKSKLIPSMAKVRAPQRPPGLFQHLAKPRCGDPHQRCGPFVH